MGVEWRVPTRPWTYAYEHGVERFGEAMAEIRKELGFETTETFSDWLYAKSKVDVPPPLLDAFEFPCLGWDSMYDVLDALAQALEVSPGTLLDEIWLRASGTHLADGTEILEDERE